MAINHNRIGNIIVKYYTTGDLDILEQLDLDEWLKIDGNRGFFEKFSDPDFVRTQLHIIQNSDKEKAWAKILGTIHAETEVPEVPTPVVLQIGRVIWPRFVAAAAVTGVIALASWFWLGHRASDNKSAVLVSKFGNDVLPGKDIAMLTLADGSKMQLTSMGNGKIARQGNARIELHDNKQLFYNADDKEPVVTGYNTLTTPPAGQFQLGLSDGTRVWLNNASSLRYPTSFGASREVDLQGEAYFEVSPDTKRPFTVKVGDQSVGVLGTSFNIAAYADETQKTTVLTGAVSVARDQGRVVLKPGQQALSSGVGDLRVLKDVDADGVVAWKNGYFHFERADLRSVMRTLARWYDVSVVYDGPVTDHVFGGDIQRNLNLSQVLDILQRNQVHFNINDRKITVRP